MSCITEILQKKGDLEFLPVERPGFSRNIVVEGGGHYKGYEWIVTFTDNGFRCGYVAIPETHPAYFDKADYPDYDVHGGITFFEESHLPDPIIGHSCTDKWIGFDCGHSFDEPDLESFNRYFPDSSQLIKSYVIEMSKIFEDRKSLVSTVKKFDYLEQECKNLIDQLIDRENK